MEKLNINKLLSDKGILVLILLLLAMLIFSMWAYQEFIPFTQAAHNVTILLCMYIVGYFLANIIESYLHTTKITKVTNVSMSKKPKPRVKKIDKPTKAKAEPAKKTKAEPAKKTKADESKKFKEHSVEPVPADQDAKVHEALTGKNNLSNPDADVHHRVSKASAIMDKFTNE